MRHIAFIGIVLAVLLISCTPQNASSNGDSDVKGELTKEVATLNYPVEEGSICNQNRQEIANETEEESYSQMKKDDYYEVFKILNRIKKTLNNQN